MLKYDHANEIVGLTLISFTYHTQEIQNEYELELARCYKHYSDCS